MSFSCKRAAAFAIASASARNISVTCEYASDMQHVDIRRWAEFARRHCFFSPSVLALIRLTCYRFASPQARVAQWIRAFASGAKGRRFDPCRGYQEIDQSRSHSNAASALTAALL